MGDERIYKIEEIVNTVERQGEKISDHDERIKKLEDGHLKLDLRMAEMQKSLTETQLLIINTSQENHKSMEKMNTTLLNTVVQAFKDNNKTDNKIKLSDRKEFWAIVAAIVTALITYLPKIIN